MLSNTNYININDQFSKKPSVTNVLITGCKQTGKTTLCKNLANKFIQNYNIKNNNILIYSNNNYSEFTEATIINNNIFNNYNYKDYNKEPYLIIIDFDKIKSLEPIKNAILNGRHFNTYVIISTENISCCDYIIRTNMDLIFSFFGSIENKQLAYNCFKYFPTYEIFDNLIKDMPQYTSFVIDTHKYNNQVYSYYKV